MGERAACARVRTQSPGSSRFCYQSFWRRRSKHFGARSERDSRATARANADLEAERRLEEFGMMPRCGLSSMFWDRELRGGGGGPVFDGGVSQRMVGIRTMAEIGGVQAPSMSGHVPTPPQAMQAMHPSVGRHGVAATRHPYMSVAHLQDTPLSEFLTRYACEPAHVAYVGRALSAYHSVAGLAVNPCT